MVSRVSGPPPEPSPGLTRGGYACGDLPLGLVVVAGSPCAGKSTWVDRHRSPGDLVLDLDAVAVRVGSAREHGHEPWVWPIVEAMVDAGVKKAGAASGLQRRVWAVRSAASPSRRESLRRAGARAVVVVETPLDVCLERSQARDGGVSAEAVRAWHAEYRRGDGDVVVSGVS